MKRLFMFLLILSAGNVFGASSYAEAMADRACSSSSAAAGVPGEVVISSGSAEVGDMANASMDELKSRYFELLAEVNENEEDLKLVNVLVTRGKELLESREPQEAITFFAAALDTCEGKLCEILPQICAWASMAFFHMGKTEEGAYYAEQAKLTENQYIKNLTARKEILRIIKEKYSASAAALTNSSQQ